jgi:hypothetical protein
MTLQVAITFGLLVGVVSGNIFNNGNLFNNGNVKKAISSAASAFACTGSGLKKRCKFNSGSLKLEDGASIQITVTEGGSPITCNHKATSNNSKGNGWYVLFVSVFSDSTGVYVL